MGIYIFIFSIVIFLAFYYQNKEVSKSSFFFVCILLGLFIGLGDMLGGYDRYIYGEVFQSQSNRLHTGADIFNTTYMMFFGHEPGYGLWNSLIGYFTPNRYIFILCTTLLIYLLLAYNLTKYCKRPYFALLLFMGLMFFFTFTYLRQVMAAMIVWTSIPFIEKKKPIIFFSLVLLGATFHNSAILFSLLYFIPIKKHQPKTIIICMLILLLIGISGITYNLFNIYGDLVQDAADKAIRYSETANFGFRIEYVIESLVFLFILLRNYNFIDKTNKRSLLFCNIYLFFCGTLLFFIKSSDGGRLSWYSIIGILYIISYLSQINYKGLLKPFIGILSFVLFFRILIGWNVFLYPYKSFLTPGFREGDYIYMHYEYDHSYDFDKLYNL